MKGSLFWEKDKINLSNIVLMKWAIKLGWEIGIQTKIKYA